MIHKNIPIIERNREMKETFTSALIEILRIDAEDIVTTSPFSVDIPTDPDEEPDEE